MVFKATFNNILVISGWDNTYTVVPSYKAASSTMTMWPYKKGGLS
jgi:hypothetical protein